MKRFTTFEITLIPLFSALIAVCSYLTIPIPNIPITLQLFAIFFALGTLGGRGGTIAVLLYLLLGAIGLPIFSGFQGGVGRLIGPTGGYLTGFLFTCLVFWAIAGEGRSLWRKAAAMCSGLLVCYAFGTAWFCLYLQGAKTVGAALMLCVIPYLPFDLLKIGLALYLSEIIGKRIRRTGIAGTGAGNDPPRPAEAKKNENRSGNE